MTQPSFLPTATHDNPYKKTVYVLVFFMVAFLVFIIAAWIAGAEPQKGDMPTLPTNMALAEDRCPEGSYEVAERDGQPICKLEATGCPYGDSIPMTECDKHAPQNTTSQNVEIVEKPVETVEKGGK